MKNQSNPRFTTLFTDIGGVLLSDGWNRKARKGAAETFNLNLDDMEERHHLTFDTFEVGKLSLDNYLERTVFYKHRDFSMEEFKEFMYQQSHPFEDMIDLICQLKKRYGLKIAVISNEGRELANYRINTFKLNEFIDFFISSSFVHLRKPDVDIFQMALDIAQVRPEDVLYIEDRPMFVQVAETLNITGIQHTDITTTRERLIEFGFDLN